MFHHPLHYSANMSVVTVVGAGDPVKKWSHDYNSLINIPDREGRVKEPEEGGSDQSPQKWPDHEEIEQQKSDIFEDKIVKRHVEKDDKAYLQKINLSHGHTMMVPSDD